MKNYEKLWEAMRSYEKQRKIMNPQWITCSASPQTDSPFQLLIEICFIPEEKYVVLWNIKYLVPCGWIYFWRKQVVKRVFKWPDVTKRAIYLKDIGSSGQYWAMRSLSGEHPESIRGIWRHRADWSVFNPLARRPRKHIFQTSSQRTSTASSEEYGMG